MKLPLITTVITTAIILAGEKFCCAQVCEPIRYSRCLGLSYSQTSFPNFYGILNQDIALQNAPFVFPSYDPISDCHPDLNFFLCSLFFPQCTSEGQIQPCRSFCNEVNATCGERALAAGLPWDTSLCPQLSDDSCSRPNGEMCEPMPMGFRATCEPFTGYNTTSFPNSFGHVSVLEIAQSQEYSRFISIRRNISTSCYTDVYTAYCRMFVPQCENGTQIQLCRSACEEINARCTPVGSGSLLSCDVLSSQDDDPTCFLDDQPTGEMCEPMPISFRATCEFVAEYNTTSFPNSFGHGSVLEIAQSQEYSRLFSNTRNISASCLTDAYAAFCRMFLPQCENGTQIQLCRSACEEINARCLPVGSDSLFPCDVLPSHDDDPTCFLSQPIVCEPIRYSRCMGLSYSQTSFPNFYQWPNQDVALQAAPSVFPSYDPISDCHPDLDFFLCSLFFPQCTSEGQIQPCRSFCNEINATCGERALAAGLQWDTSLCPQLSDVSCSRPNGTTPAATPSQQSNATVTTAPTTSQQANATASDAPTTRSQQNDTPTIADTGGAMGTGGNAGIVIAVNAAIAAVAAIAYNG